MSSTREVPGRRAPDAAGFTFVELLATMTILMFILVAAYNVIDTSQRVAAHQEEIADMDASARTAIDIMSSEIREAGYNPQKLYFPLLLPANQYGVSYIGTLGDGIDIRLDLNGDGDTRDANEWVRYAVSSGGDLSRLANTDGNDLLNGSDAAAVVLAKYVQKIGTSPYFQFIDNAGAALSTVATVQSSCESVRIRFAVKTARKDRQTKKTRFVQVQEIVVLRNIRVFPS